MRRCCAGGRRPSSRSCRRISCTNPKSAACGSTSPARRRSRTRPPTSWRARRAARPDARITGVTLHPMVVRPKARELIAGIADDPTFGPIIVFGAGGTAVEVISDKALALPPLDLQARAGSDRAHPHRARAQGLPQRPGRGSRRALRWCWSSSRSSRPTFRRSASSISIRCSPDEHGVIVVDARVAIAPVAAAAARRPRASALRGAALSEGVGEARHAARRHRDPRTADPAGGRDAVSRTSSPA